MPAMNAAEPAPRTEPYSNTPRLPFGPEAAASASASASGTSGAKAAACNRLIAASCQGTWVGT